MKELKYTPAACGEGGEFSGSLTLRPPTFDERYDALDKLGLKVNQSGEVDVADMNSFKAIRSMVDVSKKYYLSVDMKHNDGREYKCFDDLANDPDCDAILIEVAMGLSRGFRPGKN